MPIEQTRKFTGLRFQNYSTQYSYYVAEKAEWHIFCILFANNCAASGPINVIHLIKASFTLKLKKNSVLLPIIF